MKRLISLVLGIAVLIGVFVACGQTNTSDFTIRIDGMGNFGYPTPFASVPRGPSFIRASMTHDTLLWKGKDGLIPWLATSYEKTASGYIFHLRNDVKWADEVPFTADDVVFSYNYYKQHPPKGFIWGAFYMVKSVSKIDDHTVKIVPVKDTPEFLDLAVSTVFILPKHIWEHVDNPYTYTKKDAFIGTGPFILEKYDSTTGLYVYKPKKDWWGGTIPYTVEFVNSSSPVGDAAAGKLDMVYLWGSDIYSAKKVLGKGFLTKRGESYLMYFLIFNTEKLPVYVRKALASVIDRQSIVDKVAHGYGNVPDLIDVQIGKDEAQNILKDIKTLQMVTSPKFETIALAIKDQLKKAGVDVNVKMLPMGASDEAIRKGEFDIAVIAHGGLAYGPAWVNITWPYQGYHSQKWNVVAEKLKFYSPDELKENIKAVLSEEVPVLPIYTPDVMLFQKGDLPVEFFFTPRGIGAGIPIPVNKVIFIRK